METRNKILIFVFALALLLSDVSAVRINEVEANPLEGKEWIELYNDDEDINISNWEIYDGNPQKIFTIPNGTSIDKNDYYVIELNRSWLNNDGDYVTLYDNSENKIDETYTLKEGEKSSKTYQFCSSSWKFMGSTKGQENNCAEQQTEGENQTKRIDEIIEETPNDTRKNEYFYNPPKKNQTINLTPISLNAQSIKSENNNQNLKKNLALGGIISFCIGFGALFLLRRADRKKKNEFR